MLTTPELKKSKNDSKGRKGGRISKRENKTGVKKNWEKERKIEKRNIDNSDLAPELWWVQRKLALSPFKSSTRGEGREDEPLNQNASWWDGRDAQIIQNSSCHSLHFHLLLSLSLSLSLHYILVLIYFFTFPFLKKLSLNPFHTYFWDWENKITI